MYSTYLYMARVGKEPLFFGITIRPSYRGGGGGGVGEQFVRLCMYIDRYISIGSSLRI